jgi:hypothetical protein
MKEITFEEGLRIASEVKMDFEYLMNIEAGDTPYEALRDWDII